MTATAEPRVPDFFIVGHPKCGTSALSLMLKPHPQIGIPVKEPQFFAPEMRHRVHQASSPERPTTLEDYLALFADAPPGQRLGDASTLYLESPGAAQRIAEVAPAARIIAILREPVSFLRSLHMQAVHNYVETQKDFQKAIELEPLRRQGRRVPRFSQNPQRLLYSEHVRYAEHLARYRAAFPPEQMLVLIYDDFRSDNEATVRRVLRFLDVDDTLAIPPIRTKPLPAVRSHLVHQAARAIAISHRNPAAAGRASQLIYRLTPSRLNSDALQAAWRRAAYTSPREPDARFVLELRRRYKPEVVALSEYLGRDLVSEWDYDSLE